MTSSAIITKKVIFHVLFCLFVCFFKLGKREPAETGERLGGGGVAQEAGPHFGRGDGGRPGGQRGGAAGQGPDVGPVHAAAQEEPRQRHEDGTARRQVGRPDPIGA